MSVIQSVFTNGAYVAGESAIIYQKIRYFGEPAKPPLVFCHQHSATAEAMWDAPYYQRFFRALAEDFTVVAADLGYVPGQDTWGNATHRARIDSARSWLAGFGSSGKVTLAAVSMGAAGALNYAKYYGSGQVAAVAMCEPLINLWDVRDAGYSAALDGAYVGGYTDGAYGATFNPYVYQDSYDDDGIPTAMWTDPNDPIVTEPYAASFLAANPKVARFNLGAVGHTEAAIAKAIDGRTVDGSASAGAVSTNMIDWIRGRRPLIRE